VDDLYLVGAAKPLGYLPLDTILSAGYTPARVAAELEVCGLGTRLCAAEECRIASGALYVWDRDALGKLLNANRNVLDDAGWPCEADEFVQRVIGEHIFNGNSKLSSLIARAFGEPKQQTLDTI